MKTPSRRMPRLPDPPSASPGGTLLLLAVIAGLLVLPALVLAVLVTLHPLPLVALAAFIARVTFNTRAADRRMRQLRASRPAESICHFARSFERRATDTWIIRAVYEELQDHVQMTMKQPSFPVRADDSLWQDLQIVPDEIDEIVGNIATRTKRSVEDAGNNPIGELQTVRDLVVFFQHQPRLA